MLESLGFSPVTFVITIINIIILSFIFRALLFKPVTKIMAERARRIQASIDQAEKDKLQAKAMLEQYEGKLKKAEGEAEEIIRAARAEAEKEAALIIAEGKAASEALAANSRKLLEAERLAALAKFRVEATMLVIAAASKLTAREFNSEDNRRYASMMLEELSAQHAAAQQAAAQKGNS